MSASPDRALSAYFLFLDILKAESAALLKIDTSLWAATFPDTWLVSLVLWFSEIPRFQLNEDYLSKFG